MSLHAYILAEMHTLPEMLVMLTLAEILTLPPEMLEMLRFAARDAHVASLNPKPLPEMLTLTA